MTDKERIEEMEEKLKRQAEWIENNKNKAKNCAIQMQNQAKEITRLRQINKELMKVIWKTKRERARKGREVCQARNETVKANKNQNAKAVEALEKVKKHYEEQLDLAVYKNDAYNKKWFGTPDYDFGCWSNEILNQEIKFIDNLIKEYGGKK